MVETCSSFALTCTFGLKSWFWDCSLAALCSWTVAPRGVARETTLLFLIEAALEAL